MGSGYLKRRAVKPAAGFLTRSVSAATVRQQRVRWPKQPAADPFSGGCRSSPGTTVVQVDLSRDTIWYHRWLYVDCTKGSYTIDFGGAGTGGHCHGVSGAAGWGRPAQKPDNHRSGACSTSRPLGRRHVSRHRTLRPGRALGLQGPAFLGWVAFSGCCCPEGLAAARCRVMSWPRALLGSPRRWHRGRSASGAVGCRGGV